MIARHSAEESKGGGDGVEVVVNEPCHDEHHGDGRYTEKRIYLTRCVTFVRVYSTFFLQEVYTCTYICNGGVYMYIQDCGNHLL